MLCFIVMQLRELGDYIVYVAALIPRKRHADLFQAFSKIQNKKTKLVLVGKGRLQDSLESLAKQLKIEDRVVFWPWDPNPYRLIKNARLSVLASEAEGLPRVLIESIIIGTTVVSKDCPSGPNEVLLGANAKYLVPVGDVDKLRLAMNDILARKQQQIFDLKRFDATKVAMAYEDLINV
jgi:glycosyltransferase involved in cell wall biosynthesis